MRSKKFIQNQEEYGSLKTKKATGRTKRALIRKAAKGSWEPWGNCRDPQLRTIISRTIQTSGFYRIVARRKQLLKQSNRKSHFQLSKSHEGDT